MYGTVTTHASFSIWRETGPLADRHTDVETPRKTERVGRGGWGVGVGRDRGMGGGGVGDRNCEGRNGQNEELKLFCILLTLSLPTNCITDAVSSRDHSPEKG